ncbi:hypothetical protein [Prevotella jejuni]
MFCWQEGRPLEARKAYTDSEETKNIYIQGLMLLCGWALGLL